MAITLHPEAECLRVPGAKPLWADKTLRWLWIGETHGTNESPSAFGKLVCDALQNGRLVTVALERPRTEEALINSLLSSGDPTGPEKALLSAATWRMGYDGRASRAMMNLLLYLRLLKQRFPKLRVALVDEAIDPSIPQDRDQLMGKHVLSLDQSEATSLVLILTGNVHAHRAAFNGTSSAAMYLPQEHTILLDIVGWGGRVWNWQEAGCGDFDMPAEGTNRKTFGIFLSGDKRKVQRSDGILSVGSQFTPSEPAVKDELSSAPCRKEFVFHHNAVRDPAE